MSSVHLSVVSPVYGAAELIEELTRRTVQAASRISTSFEIILVEDRSPDNSWEAVLRASKEYQQVRGLRLSRNFGQQAAIHAGLQASRGEWVVVLDCDLQDPPEDILLLYQKAQEGYEIVQGSRAVREDSAGKRLSSFLFNRLMGFLTDTQQDPTVANFALLHRKAVDAICRFQENDRYFPLLMEWVGFRRTKVPITHQARPDGSGSSYSFRKKLQLALNTAIAYSDKPLRLVVTLGLIFTMLSVLGAALLIILFFMGTYHAPGWASLATMVSFYSGVIVTVLGTIGLYLGKTFQGVKDRPLYLIDEETSPE